MDIQTIISTFVGFILALLTAYLGIVIEKRISINKAMRNIDDELWHIYYGFYDKEAKKIRRSRLYIFHTPIWDSVVSAGDLLIMQNKHSEYYDQVLAVYDGLRAIEQMQSVDNEGFKEYIDKEVEEIVKQIPPILNREK